MNVENYLQWRNNPVAESSSVHVSHESKRILKNTGSRDMIMTCVHHRGVTFDITDAAINDIPRGTATRVIA